MNWNTHLTTRNRITHTPCKNVAGVSDDFRGNRN